MESIEQFLKQRQAQHTLRVLSPLTSRRPGKAIQAGREYVDFSSNDYLGLSSHHELIDAARAALESFGVGASASRLMSGDLEAHHELEEETAAFKGKEDALLFNSGYQANVGIIPAMAGRQDAVFADRLSHASLMDGILLSRAKCFRFRHNDTEHLERLLEQHRKNFESALIVTESVFSMDGDRAPLRRLVELKNRYGCTFFVDEAHATGVFGSQGRGCVNEDDLTEDVELVMGTFSKALGGFGAYLAASHDVVHYLTNAARSFVYSTALPAAVVAADLAAIRLCSKGLDRGSILLQKAERFRQALRSSGFLVLGSSQIVPVVIGDTEKTVCLSEGLLERGFRVLPVRPPTVPEAQSRLRFSLCYFHSDEELQAVVEALCELA